MEKSEKIMKTIIPGFFSSESEKICPKHGCHMRHTKIVTKSFSKESDYCPKCWEEQREAEEAQISYEVNKKFAIGETYGWLERFSLIPDSTLTAASFGSYEVLEKEETENKQKAIQAYQRLKSGEIFNVWIAGKQGVGKSHLAMSILRNLNEAGKKAIEENVQHDKCSGGYKCLFINFEEMLRKIRNSFSRPDSPYSEEYFIDKLSEADFLVLDDLGAETGSIDTNKVATDFVHRVLYAVGNARQDKSTIITTNLTSQQLQQMYDRKVLSRFFRNMTQIVFSKTKDHRASIMDF